MLRIVFAAKNYSGFVSLVDRLRQEPKTELIPVSSASAALQTLAEKNVQLLVAAELLEDSSGVACVRQVATQFPLVHTALCSALAPEDFHEFTEGLGVLMQLPLQPDHSDAEQILQRMAHISGLLNNTTANAPNQ